MEGTTSANGQTKNDPMEEEVAVKAPARKPLDLEAELQKKRQSENQQAKPVFLSKQEREALALQRRAEQVEQRMERMRAIEAERERFVGDQKGEKESESSERGRERDGRSRRRSRSRSRSRDRRDRWRDRSDRDRDRDRRRDRSRSPRGRNRSRSPRDRRRGDRSRSRSPTSEKSGSVGPESLRLTDKEMEMIRRRHLGGPKEKKKILKLSEKFKFNFDWDAGEDTSVELNPILEKAKSEIRPLFGRGYLGGIDHQEQAKEIKKMEIEKPFAPHTPSTTKLTTLDRAILPTRSWREKSLEDMTDRDWRIFKEEFNITTRGGSIPNPIRYWKEASLSKNILRACEKFGYKDPTPIQRQAIPVGLQGRDIIGIAETGSGKTAAFVFPMLEYIMKLPKMTPESALEGPYALIMAPTRELAQQIAQETERFANLCDIRVLSIVGGTAIEQQGFRLRQGVEILIATPGRLADLVDSRYLVLNQCTYVVLDEADRMIDMGFEPQVNKVLDYMPSSHLKSEDEQEAAEQEGKLGAYRTTIMYSATMPVGVERLARKFLRRPAYVIIGEIGRAVERIKQVVEWVREEGEKSRRIVQLLNETGKGPIIIFVNKKTTAETLSKQLFKFNWRCTTLHSGKNQQAREAAIIGFKAGHFDVLIATDVAGRGIDVPGVIHVINYDMPKSIEDYTHRIGRTGRAGLEGLATSFLTSEDTDVFYDLKKMLLDSGMFVPPELANHPAAEYKPGTIPDRKPRRDTIIYAVKS